MMSQVLPSVLQGTKGNSSISMERALKQVKTLLESLYDYTQSDSMHDRIDASIDDVKTMLGAIQ